MIILGMIGCISNVGIESIDMKIIKMTLKVLGSERG